MPRIGTRGRICAEACQHCGKTQTWVGDDEDADPIWPCWHCGKPFLEPEPESAEVNEPEPPAPSDG